MIDSQTELDRSVAWPPLPLAFDFLNHALHISTSGGEQQQMRLQPRTVADFYGELMARLDEVGMPVSILARPVEVVEATPFAEDHAHNAYDAAAALGNWDRAALERR